jgi:hypothetical protein
VFKTHYVNKLVQRDNFEQGCHGKFTDCSYEFTIQGETLPEVVKAIAEHVGCKPEHVTVNPCGDDPSRIDAQRMENDNGDDPTQSELKAFEAGKIDLWVADYSFYFEETKPANFE